MASKTRYSKQDKIWQARQDTASKTRYSKQDKIQQARQDTASKARYSKQDIVYRINIKKVRYENNSFR